MAGSSMGCVRPGGAELSSGLTGGTQRCSVTRVSSSSCVCPTDGGPRGQRWREHDVAVQSQRGPRPPQSPCYRGKRWPGLCCPKAGGSGQRELQGEGTKIRAKSWGQLRSIKSSKVAVGDMSRETPAAPKGAWRAATGTQAGWRDGVFWVRVPRVTDTGGVVCELWVRAWLGIGGLLMGLVVRFGWRHTWRHTGDTHGGGRGQPGLYHLSGHSRSREAQSRSCPSGARRGACGLLSACASEGGQNSKTTAMARCSPVLSRDQTASLVPSGGVTPLRTVLGPPHPPGASETLCPAPPS